MNPPPALSCHDFFGQLREKAGLSGCSRFQASTAFHYKVKVGSILGGHGMGNLTLPCVRTSIIRNPEERMQSRNTA